MSSTIYPPLSASYPYVQGHNVKNYNIFSQRLIGTLGRNSRSKIVSLKTINSSSTSGHGLPAGGSGFKIINQMSDGYFDDSLYQEAGVSIVQVENPYTSSYVLIEIMNTGSMPAASSHNMKLRINVWDTQNINDGAEELTFGTGSLMQVEGGIQRWTSWNGTAYADGPEDGFVIYSRPSGMPGIRSDTKFSSAYKPPLAFSYTGSYAGSAITGSSLLAEDLYYTLSGAIYWGRDGYGNLATSTGTGFRGGMPVWGRASPWSGLPLEVTWRGRYDKHGAASKIIRLETTGSRYVVGVTSSFPDGFIKITSVSPGDSPASWTSDIGISSFSETEGSLTFLPQYNLEQSDFGYQVPATFTPFAEKTSLMGFGSATPSSGLNSGFARTTTADDLWYDFYTPRLGVIPPPRASRGWRGQRHKFRKRRNPYHLGKLYIDSQFITGSEINYGTPGSPIFRYTEVRKFKYEFDISQIPGDRYDLDHRFYWSGIIEPLDIRKEITGDHTVIGDFYDPIANTLKGSVQSTERQLTHLGITVPISENYDIVNDRKITPFELLDRSSDEYSLSFAVGKYVETVPREHVIHVSRHYYEPGSAPVGEYFLGAVAESIEPIDLVERNGILGSYTTTTLATIRPSHDFPVLSTRFADSQYSVRGSTKNIIAHEMSKAINSGSMGAYVSSSVARGDSYGFEVASAPQVIITAISGNVANGTAVPVKWPNNWSLEDPNTFNPDFHQFSLSSVPARKSTGGTFNNHSIFLNLLDLTENPEPFLEIETNTENYETLLRTSDRELQYVLANSSSLVVKRGFKMNLHPGALPYDAGYPTSTAQEEAREYYFGSHDYRTIPRGTAQMMRCQYKHTRPMTPFSDTEKSTPRGLVYENAVFGYDSIAFGGYKK